MSRRRPAGLGGFWRGSVTLLEHAALAHRRRLAGGDQDCDVPGRELVLVENLDVVGQPSMANLDGLTLDRRSLGNVVFTVTTSPTGDASSARVDWPSGGASHPN